MGVWMGGWLDGWTDPSVVRAQEVQEQVGVVAEQAKKWRLPCKSAWTWLCGSAITLARSCSSGSRVLVYPFPQWEATFAVARRVFVGAVARRWEHNPCHFPLWHVVLACMRWHIPPKIRFPHQPLPV